ncbi:hypothetical protein GCM10009680_56940 [Streptomyces yatensis]|uniref:Uncharacterized protein n=1 Tax=Streptomyces yatensis TaxID=155177 RepID=A0ABP4USB1_9ACTN
MELAEHFGDAFPVGAVADQFAAARRLEQAAAPEDREVLGGGRRAEPGALGNLTDGQFLPVAKCAKSLWRFRWPAP